MDNKKFINYLFSNCSEEINFTENFHVSKRLQLLLLHIFSLNIDAILKRFTFCHLVVHIIAFSPHNLPNCSSENYFFTQTQMRIPTI